MKPFITSFLLLLLTSCGSQNTEYVELSDDILNGLKRKQQSECLAGKEELYNTLVAKGKALFESLDVENTWTITYTEVDKTSDDEETTHTITINLKEKNLSQANSLSNYLLFSIQNENATDSTPNDYTVYKYTLQNQEDHINLLLAEACLGDNPNFSESQISATINTNSTTRTFLYLSQYPAFFARYTSYVSEVRDGDTTDSNGEVQTTLSATAPSQESDSDPVGDDFTTTQPDFTTVSTTGTKPSIPSDSSQCLTSIFGIYSGDNIIKPSCG